MGSLGIAWDKSGCKTVGWEMSFRNALQAEDGWFMCWSTQVSFPNLFPHQGQNEVFHMHERVFFAFGMMEDENSDAKSCKYNTTKWCMYSISDCTPTFNMRPSSPQAAHLGVPPPDIDSILLQMEQTGEWVSSSLFFFLTF